MADRSQPKNYFIDMDGVLMRGAAPIPGAADFIRRLVERGAKFLLLTNNSLYTPCGCGSSEVGSRYRPSRSTPPR